MSWARSRTGAVAKPSHSAPERKRKAAGHAEDWRRRGAKRRKRVAERAEVFCRPRLAERCRGSSEAYSSCRITGTWSAFADECVEEGCPARDKKTVTIGGVSSMKVTVRISRLVTDVKSHLVSVRWAPRKTHLGIDEYGLSTKRRRSISIDRSADERQIFMSCFAATGKSECESRSQFFCRALTASRKSSLFALAMGAVCVAQSTMSLFPPSFVRTAGPLQLALPPLVYFALFAFSIGQVATMTQSYEEFVEHWRENVCFYALRVSTLGALYLGARFLVHSSGSSRAMFFAELLSVPAAMNLDMTFAVLYGALRRGLRPMEIVRAISRLLLMGSYVGALTLMLFANVYYLPRAELGGYRLGDYMGAVVGCEKALLLLLKNLCIQKGPCGFPRVLFSLSVHFELDTALLAGLAMGASQSPAVALQHLAVDWAMAGFELWSTLSFDLNMTMAEMQEMHWFVRLQYWPSVYLSGSTALWSSNLFVGRVMNNLLDRLAKTAGYAWVLCFLSLVTLGGGLSTDPYRPKLGQYFLPAGTWGLVYLAAQLFCSVLQDLVVKLALTRRGVKAAKFMDSLTKNPKQAVYYAFYFSYSAWLLHCVSVIAWRVGNDLSY